jgi:hypothetical protein
MAESGYIPTAPRERVENAVRLRGPRAVAGEFARWGGRLAAGVPVALTSGQRGAFTYEGETYPYLYATYKRSWQTERAVEVPIVRRIVEAHAGRRVLEVGHVLGHYGTVSHTVVDKYEQAPGVLNLDVFDLEREGLGPFDLVVTISTVEHVGWDESPRVPGKAAEAIEALDRLVAPGGTLLVTIPLNYNPPLDEAFRSGAIPFDHVGALRREGGGTRWRQVAPDAVGPAPYDFLLYSSRAVLIATRSRDSG